MEVSWDFEIPVAVWALCVRRRDAFHLIADMKAGVSPIGLFDPACLIICSFLLLRTSELGVAAVSPKAYLHGRMARRGVPVDRLIVEKNSSKSLH